MTLQSEQPPQWADALSKILSDLKNKKEEDRIRGAKNLKNYVITQSREMTNENFSNFMQDVNTIIFELVNSSGITDKIGGILAIDELIDVDYDENAAKITKLANYLRYGLSTNDQTVMMMASRALGRLARSSGTLTAECVEFEVTRALEWLSGERVENRRQASVLVLKELAQNAPTLFYVHAASFIDLIWVALKDVKLSIREGAVEALRACLELIAERESRLRLQWYQKIYDESQKAFKQNGSPEALHGSLITLGELLRNTGDFMVNKFKDVCDTILKHKDHRDKLVKKTVIVLLPRLAIFSPREFVHLHLNTCINYILSALRNQNERSYSFIALGEIAQAVGGSIKPYLDNIVVNIKTALQTKGKQFCPEVLTCISMLSSAVGPGMIPHMQVILPQMFAPGLTQVLTEALRDLTVSLPALIPHIQQKLLTLLSQVLANKPFSQPGAPNHYRKSTAPFQNLSVTHAVASTAASDVDPEMIALALKTLGSFDLSKHNLLEFVRECVVGYLDDDNSEIRREAAITCSQLMVRPGEPAPTRGHSAVIVGEVLEKLLVVGIADPDPSIRRTVLSSLDTRFDHHLAQAENLRSLFIALNDEVFEIRELAISVIGRLTIRNPAYVMPSLRKTLIQLLTELEFSGDSRNKEESARLLGHLIGASEKLIKPYVEPILKALLPKLRDSNPRVASCVLAALGELSVVGGDEMSQHIDQLLPLIIDTLQDQSSTSKREVALKTLGQLASSTGYVIRPFAKYPMLLDILLNAIKTERIASIRREVIKVLGILGALDPYKHKMNELGQRREDPKLDDKSSSSSSGAGTSVIDSINISPSSEDYYPTVAITALMKILRDPSLSAHHSSVIQAVMFIFKSLGFKCIPFLPQIMPPFLHVMNSCEPGFRDFLFQQLSTLVSIVKQHIRDYLNDIFILIEKYWNSYLLIPIIHLVEEISTALNDEFKVYLPNLIPQMLNVLHTDRSPKRLPTTKVLKALEVFGTNLDDYLHLVIPAVVKLFEQVDVTTQVRTLAIQTIGRLCKKLNFSDYASRIIHPLARVLDVPGENDLKDDALQTLCSLVYQLGSDYAIFIPMVGKVLNKREISSASYELLVSKLLKNQQLISTGGPEDFPGARHPDTVSEDGQNTTPSPEIGFKKLKVNEQHLKNAWETSQRSTKEDWVEWIRRFSVELLRESPSPALRSCLSLAQDYHPLVKELFNAGFVSCWTELHEQYQDELVHSLEAALMSPNIPPEILQTLLNLAEFMELHEKPLPIDIRTLGALAEKCHAYAKALHYKEIEFQQSIGSNSTIEALISINNQLQQPEAAIGILIYAQKNHSVELKETWYEKLRRWEDALAAYERKQKDDTLTNIDNTLGIMRCLHALGEWERLSLLSADLWKTASESTRTAIAPLASAAAWNLSSWDSMDEYARAMSLDSIEGSFYRAILEVHKDNFTQASCFIERARSLVDTELTALLGESYNRAYKMVVRLQQLSELEEIIEYKKSTDSIDRKTMIKNTWKKRLSGCQMNVDIWQSVLAVHSLVISPHEELDMWLKFVGLCRKGSRLGLAQKTLTMLMGKDPNALQFGQLLPNTHPRITFAYIKQLWSAGAKQPAFERLRTFVQAMRDTDDHPLQARAYLKLGEWQSALGDVLNEASIPQIIASFKSATEMDPNWYKAWHSWALINFEVVSHYEQNSGTAEQIAAHLLPAVNSFFKSIALAPDQSLQDTLRLLTLWFKHGAQKEVEQSLMQGFNDISIDTWLQVIPQLIARIHAPVFPVRRLLHELLDNIGKEHPQALVYPLTVATKSQSPARLAAAKLIMDRMRKHTSLVDVALPISQELVRSAILWHEMWYEGLEEASRQYFGEHNPDAMLATLAPLHQILEKGPETTSETSFIHAFGRDLAEALEWSKKYERSRKEGDLNQAWDLYYQVFRRIYKQLPQMISLELQYISPKLMNSVDMDLVVPGTYRAGEPIIRIQSFSSILSVIPSKQRPRKLTIIGSDGLEYTFLLKGHEDLRQDERVMQLFGLVNTSLSANHETAKSHLSIRRFSVIPLSPNSGLIGWVPHSDTLHTLIKDYRESSKILLNIEHRLMLQMCTDYDNLTLLQKVEVFEYALESTNGQDLHKVLWLKSRNSEIWLDRRTNYTRSLAVMSMVGYILGLGDRHPSNLMLDRHTGRILHIDFGDCFEVAMHREKYPEKIPFRLTRMLINAMEVSGIEGNFRLTCETVMTVLRNNKESLTAVLEAFVHDPLINWRLLTPNAHIDKDKEQKIKQQDLVNVENGDNSPLEPSPPPALAGSPVHRQPLITRGHHGRVDEQVEPEVVPEALNERALSVINRVNKKLTGRDFGNSPTPLDVPEQVQKLIDQATSHENLSQCYVGWCAFW
ncbi:protein kinase [Cavenderia fasciculata]|uniref:non-specific serine/threonine protein kinase n=1 Tax=Cavenderia fasciculata TaxID=261658 RepID=F4Q8Y8_CACFS|nr:protein kinase [Cavenderia fasciculata]EGG15157.1 protein kinase [Cavenderia fasciculata]|eukprot:XP_004351877.1 protein kinase [Cavenderia fasciculata]